jgi:hypothetical protein
VGAWSSQQQSVGDLTRKQTAAAANAQQQMSIAIGELETSHVSRQQAGDSFDVASD